MSDFTRGDRSERMAVTFSLGFPSHEFVSFIKLSKLLVTDRLAKQANLGRALGASLVAKMSEEPDTT